MNNTEERVVMPAPGASLKGVQAYLSRWGLAQPKPMLLTTFDTRIVRFARTLVFRRRHWAGVGGGLHYGYGYRLQAIGHANPRSGRTARQETGLDVWSLVACGG